MDVLKIVWTATALQQRNFIFHYWNERNKSNLYSKKLNSSLKQRIEKSNFTWTFQRFLQKN
ncbi:MAG: hypothetical protein FD181_3213 [Prolixibacteraceae bacterium]|nr:MAG: hypothetical protein FD181_3213 [Prolixibacteraceae bacterium]